MFCISDAFIDGDRRRGVLVSFPCRKVMSMNYCCHEASHVCDAIEEYTDLEHGGEPSAYLMGVGLRLASTMLVWALVISLN